MYQKNIAFIISWTIIFMPFSSCHAMDNPLTANMSPQESEAFESLKELIDGQNTEGLIESLLNRLPDDEKGKELKEKIKMVAALFKKYGPYLKNQEEEDETKEKLHDVFGELDKEELNTLSKSLETLYSKLDSQIDLLIKKSPAKVSKKMLLLKLAALNNENPHMKSLLEFYCPVLEMGEITNSSTDLINKLVGYTLIANTHLLIEKEGAAIWLKSIFDILYNAGINLLQEKSPASIVDPHLNTIKMLDKSGLVVIFDVSLKNICGDLESAIKKLFEGEFWNSLQVFLINLFGDIQSTKTTSTKNNSGDDLMKIEEAFSTVESVIGIDAMDLIRDKSVDPSLSSKTGTFMRINSTYNLWKRKQQQEGSSDAEEDESNDE